MNLKDLNIKLKNLIKGVNSTDLYDEIGDKLSKEVVKRTASGFGVDNEGAKASKLKALDTSYKKERKSLRRRGILSSETTPAKSNLTKTRKMLDAVDYKSGAKSVNILIKGKKNRQKAIYQEDQGRPFMNLSKGEIQQVEDIVENKIRTDIKKKGL